jgi:hypothetical protein
MLGLITKSYAQCTVQVIVNPTEWNSKWQLYLAAFITLVHNLLQCNVSYESVFSARAQMIIQSNLSRATFSLFIIISILAECPQCYCGEIRQILTEHFRNFDHFEISSWSQGIRMRSFVKIGLFVLEL